jgi:hypothetical protein
MASPSFLLSFVDFNLCFVGRKELRRGENVVLNVVFLEILKEEVQYGLQLVDDNALCHFNALCAFISSDSGEYCSEEKKKKMRRLGDEGNSKQMPRDLV